MRSLIIILLSLGLTITACSKKGGGSTPPPPAGGSGGGGHVGGTVNDLSLDGIYTDSTSSGWVVVDTPSESTSRNTFQTFLKAAIYQQVYDGAPYGEHTFNYFAAPSCSNSFLDDLYDYNHDLDFATCSQYNSFINSVALSSNPDDNLFYVELQQVSEDEVDGTISITSYAGGSTYITELEIPFHGFISEEDAGGGDTYFAIEVGGLTFTTPDSSQGNPNNRYINVDFGGTDLGSIQFQP